MSNLSANVDCTGVARSVWLVKVPKYLSDAWNRADASGIVGSLRIPVTRSSGSQQVSFQLSESLSESGKIDGASLPRDHKLLMSDVSQSLAAFSEKLGELILHAHLEHLGNGERTGYYKKYIPFDEPESGQSSTGEDQFSFEGKIVKRADCRPVENPHYMAMKKKSIVLAGKPVGKIKQLTSIKGRNIYKPVSEHREHAESEKRKKEEGKRVRASTEEVREMLYGAFEKHQYYSLKDLVQITQQPVVHLKNVLKEICVYNTKNPHKNMWELKQEYRHYKGEDEKK